MGNPSLLPTRGFVFFTSRRWCRMGFLNHQPVSLVFSSLGWPHCAGSAAGTGHSLAGELAGGKSGLLGKKIGRNSHCVGRVSLTNPFEIICACQIGNHSFSPWKTGENSIKYLLQPPPIRSPYALRISFWEWAKWFAAVLIYALITKYLSF